MKITLYKMVDVVIIDKTGKIKEEKINEISLENISKKCRFRKLTNFDKRHTWKIKIKNQILCVSVFARVEGRANNENKYEMPYPLDKELYFGSIAILAHKGEFKDEKFINISKNMWKLIYDKLMGGFEDISKSEEEEEEEEFVAPENLTKHGYKKDNFVVDEEQYESDKSFHENEAEVEEAEEDTPEESEEEIEEELEEELEITDEEHETSNIIEAMSEEEHETSNMIEAMSEEEYEEEYEEEEEEDIGCISELSEDEYLSE